MFVIVAHDLYRWVGQLVASLFCIVPSGIIKTSFQRGGIYFSPIWGPLSPVSEVHDIFSNRDSPSTYEGVGKLGNREHTACFVSFLDNSNHQILSGFFGHFW